MEGIIVFHQGWTDIINSIPIVLYYQNKYNKLYIVIRKDAENLMTYVFNKYNNIKLILCSKYDIDYNLSYITLSYEEKFKIKLDKIYIGLHDTLRNDSYKNSWQITQQKNINWLKSFYLAYDIPFINRVSLFNIIRNEELENNRYNQFIEKYGNTYALYHNNGNLIDNEILTCMSNNPSITYINIDNHSDLFFDYIKILENAKEIHLIDSVWGNLVYLLDAKYRLFKHIQIYAYCKRFFKEMFTEPLQLDNWIVV